ncbi:lipoate--protein ligase family protein [Paenibacillus physcomitrellae]|uniref:lipoate--protein ligase family protein n=1 Tax=Paenibacillus physcomitrellae TaxID=1619311 RepID=UPI000B8C9E4F|nr:lipoate--protein ligase family protein [Paenibacillus physcomitrellae]
MPAWRFVHTGRRTGAMNMAIDEAMMIAQQEGRVPPTVRFYNWLPGTLTVGYFQKAEKEIDFTAVERHGVGFVRRPTGGRAVLHDREVTYSLVVPETYPGLPARVDEGYRVLSEGLLYGFRRLGLDAEMTGGYSLAAGETPQAARLSRSAACFDSPSRYELTVEGRKIAGSAQMRTRGIVLQHGSIPVDPQIDFLFELLHFSENRTKERWKRIVEEKAVAINEVLKRKNGREVTLEEAEEAFRIGFAEAFGASLVAEPLTEYEEELAEELVRTKYGTEEWNRSR